jgi:hypothetical protein
MNCRAVAFIIGNTECRCGCHPDYVLLHQLSRSARRSSIGFLPKRPVSVSIERSVSPGLLMLSCSVYTHGSSLNKSGTNERSESCFQHFFTNWVIED